MDKFIKGELLDALDALPDEILPVSVTKEQEDDNGCSYGLLERNQTDRKMFVLADRHNGPDINPRKLLVESLPASAILDIVKDALAAAARYLSENNTEDASLMKDVLSLAGRYINLTPRSVAARFINECLTVEDQAWSWHKRQRTVIGFNGTNELDKPFVNTDDGVYRTDGGLRFGEVELIASEGEDYILETVVGGCWNLTIRVTPETIDIEDGIKAGIPDKEITTILPDESVLLLEAWFDRIYKF